MKTQVAKIVMTVIVTCLLGGAGYFTFELIRRTIFDDHVTGIIHEIKSNYRFNHSHRSYCIHFYYQSDSAHKVFYGSNFQMQKTGDHVDLIIPPGKPKEADLYANYWVLPPALSIFGLFFGYFLLLEFRKSRKAHQTS